MFREEVVVTTLYLCIHRKVSCFSQVSRAVHLPSNLSPLHSEEAYRGARSVDEYLFRVSALITIRRRDISPRASRGFVGRGYQRQLVWMEESLHRGQASGAERGSIFIGNPLRDFPQQVSDGFRIFRKGTRVRVNTSGL